MREDKRSREGMLSCLLCFLYTEWNIPPQAPVFWLHFFCIRIRPPLPPPWTAARDPHDHFLKSSNPSSVQTWKLITPHFNKPYSADKKEKLPVEKPELCDCRWFDLGGCFYFVCVQFYFLCLRFISWANCAQLNPVQSLPLFKAWFLVSASWLLLPERLLPAVCADSLRVSSIVFSCGLFLPVGLGFV